VAAVHHIGKEANKWAEQHYLGFDEGEQIEYGTSPKGLTVVREKICTAAKMLGQRELAGYLGMARETLAKMLRGEETRHLRSRSTHIVGAIEQLMAAVPHRRKR
jgi:hypothetical protein